MAQPTNRQELIQYCYRTLGKGAIDINVTDEQADDRVDEALDYITLFHFDGVEKAYLSMTVDANNSSNGYFLMPNNVVSVTRIFPLTGAGAQGNGINGDFNIFDLNYQLRLNELYDFTSADYVYFELANEHIRTLEILFIGDVPIRYNRYTNLLHVDMQWDARVAIGSKVIAECYIVLDWNNSQSFWSDMMLKKLTTALIKRQWGANLSKFAGVQLPNGMVANGEKIFNDAEAEIERLKEEIRSTFEAPPQWEIG
jgi:hypothetical protein